MALFEPIPPVAADLSIADTARCQEASMFSRDSYIPCGAAAVAIVDNGDSRPYYMCEGCTDHNIRNRGARVLARKKGNFNPLDVLKNDVPTKSWVIWFVDGRYSYAWGETPDAALDSWLENFKREVRIIVSAGDYKSALPVTQYLREMNGQV